MCDPQASGASGKIDALQALLTANAVELLSDGQKFYGVNFNDLIEDDPDYAQSLIGGLLTEPRSLYRAKYLQRHPPKQGKSSRAMGWYEWSPTLQILVAIYNHMVLRDGGKKAEKHTLRPPSDKLVVDGSDMDAMLKMFGGQ